MKLNITLVLSCYPHTHPPKGFKSCLLFSLPASPLWAVDPLKAVLKWRSCRKCLRHELKACGWCGQQLRLLIQTKHKGQRALFADGDSTALLLLRRCFFNTTFTWKWALSWSAFCFDSYSHTQPFAWPPLIKFYLNSLQMDRVLYSGCYNTDNADQCDQCVSSQSVFEEKVEKGQRTRSCDFGAFYSSSGMLTVHTFIGFGPLSCCTIESGPNCWVSTAVYWTVHWPGRSWKISFM